MIKRFRKKKNIVMPPSFYVLGNFDEVIKKMKEAKVMSSDDIVTRLRGKRTEFDNWLNDIEGKYSFGHDESLWSEAADEIERLRAEVTQLRSFLHPIGTVINGQAVRGE